MKNKAHTALYSERLESWAYLSKASDTAVKARVYDELEADKVSLDIHGKRELKNGPRGVGWID